MSIKARQKLVPASKYDIKCPSTMVAEYITVHNTANDASADSEVSYMISNNNVTSFHFAIDDKEVVQGLPVNRHAWHTGDGGKGEGNLKSIGIEICYSKSGGDKYKKAEALAIKFIAQLLKERKWEIDRVRTHKSWTEIGVKRGLSKYVKNCPHRILDEGRWSSFLNAIKVELKKLIDMDKPKVVVPKKEATESPSKVSVSKPVSVSKVEIEIINVKVSAIILDIPDRDKAKSLGEIKKGSKIKVLGVVKGKNNPNGYWEIIYKGKLCYISYQFGKRI